MAPGRTVFSYQCRPSRGRPGDIVLKTHYTLIPLGVKAKVSHVFNSSTTPSRNPAGEFRDSARYADVWLLVLNERMCRQPPMGFLLGHRGYFLRHGEINFCMKIYIPPTMNLTTGIPYFEKNHCFPPTTKTARYSKGYRTCQLTTYLESSQEKY